MTDDLTALRRMAEENARIAQETGVGSGSIAFEPQAVLALLDRLERAERELEVAMAPHSDCVESGERVGAQIDDLRSRAERAAAAKARGEALIEAVQAHRNLHRAYASTSVCRGGIGGQAITSHCGEVCDNYEAHEKDTEAWTELEVEAIDYSRARAEAYRQERGEQ